MLRFARQREQSGRWGHFGHVVPNCLVAIVIAVTLIGLSSSPGRASASGVWYVSTTGTNQSDCLSPATACRTITHALTKAFPNDTIIIASGLYTENLTISKSIVLVGASTNSTIIDGSKINQAVSISPGASASLSYLTIQNGSSITGTGGGIRNSGTLILANTVISGNVASNGGGIRNNGILVVRDSWITNNSASANGGGIDVGLGASTTVSRSTISRNVATNGGGVRNNSNSVLTVTESVISGNGANTNGGGIFLSISSTLLLQRSAIVYNHANNDGGGIFVTRNVPTPLIENVTIGANSAAKFGGGIFNSSNMRLTNVTLNANASQLGKGSNLYLSSTLQLRNTIVANGLGSNCSYGGTFSITSLGHNLDSGNTCVLTGTADLSQVDPQLGALAVDSILGNVTLVYALHRGSPAIDAGSNVGCPATDQRGVIRPIDGTHSGTPTCDIGAYEFNYLFTFYLPKAART